MADPSRLDASDWFNAGLAVLLAGIGGLVKFFYNSKKALTQEIEDTNTRLEEHLKQDALRHELHSVELAKVQTNQRNMDDRLEDIKDEIQRSADRGAQTVNSQFVQLLGEIRKIGN